MSYTWQNPWESERIFRLWSIKRWTLVEILPSNTRHISDSPMNFLLISSDSRMKNNETGSIKHHASCLRCVQWFSDDHHCFTSVYLIGQCSCDIPSSRLCLTLKPCEERSSMVIDTLHWLQYQHESIDLPASAPAKHWQQSSTLLYSQILSLSLALFTFVFSLTEDFSSIAPLMAVWDFGTSSV